jgi:hypothetical protein
MQWERPVLALFLAALASGCSKVETKRLLPWFETRTRQTRTIGPVSVGSSGTTPYVRRFGLFWTEVSGCLDGEVLDADTVAVSCSDAFNRGTALLRRGETVARPACGTYASFSQILPDRSGVDCTTVLAGNAPVVPTRLRYWRVAPSRETLFDATLAIDEPGRSFVGPVPRFYDERMRGYFVAEAEDFQQPPDCALFGVEAGNLTRVASAPEMRRADCADASPWSQRIGRTLRLR